MSSLDELTSWVNEVKLRIKIISKMDFRGYRNMRITYLSDCFIHSEVNPSEDKNIMRNVFRYYKLQQYLRIVELTRRIASIVPGYISSDSIVREAILSEEDPEKVILSYI